MTSKARKGVRAGCRSGEQTYKGQVWWLISVPVAVLISDAERSATLVLLIYIVVSEILTSHTEMLDMKL